MKYIVKNGIVDVVKEDIMDDTLDRILDKADRVIDAIQRMEKILDGFNEEKKYDK